MQEALALAWPCGQTTTLSCAHAFGGKLSEISFTVFHEDSQSKYNSHEYSYLYREKLSTCYTIRLWSVGNLTNFACFPTGMSLNQSTFLRSWDT